ncbi:LOW QUALITY PROTEIN: adenomatous polyposis coli protein [Sebastes umbrosus]|uniref:LOW QUALITY PROTEIN: adenomatous polyposis coli protein n=1 Tax=Sebastes umbrosus TaxID=72105 RepID=UPI0018A087F3|nr:LOW QUALITY PROTEIN: adenomatous polyposis coli protein [Sebastes umbrosus]
MAAASYDQLLRQVEVLKMENSNLRQELQDNSNHLTKLESEACNMKEVLKQLQGTIEEESGDASGSQLELIERLKEMSLESAGFKPRSRPPLPPSSSSSSTSSGSGAPGGAAGGSGAPGPPTTAGFPRRGLPTAGRDSHDRCLEDLEKERSLLLAELEKEEKEKDWYYAQLQNLTKRIDSLPLTENFTLQTDMSRRQLEFEARQIRSAMEEQLGSCQEMERRAQARVSRIQQIEKDILRLGARLQVASQVTSQVEEAQGPSDSSGLAGVQSSSSRLDHEPANEASYSVPRRITSHLGTKVEMVYSLLSMLGTHDKDDMSRTLLAMSSSQDSCIAMRQSGCLPLLIQLLHGNDKDSLLLGNSRGSKEARARASAALHNIVHSQPDDKRGRREIRVLHLLEQVRHYCEECWSWQENHERGVDQEDNPMPSPVEHQICPAVCVLMKLSFDEEHRHAMNELGGLQAVAELLQVDCEMFGLSSDHYSVTLRRYAGMALTNLTFGDVANKATLCSMKGCMRAMVAQLKSDSEDLQQVIASVLRNLSWRADVNSKKTLREVGSVRALTGCALEVQKESTLKSVLSALWNLSAHCTENKADICAVDGALAFLVGTLTHCSHTNTLAIIESGGGILRNVSSLIATNEAHRQILREHGCLPTLLQHLKSHSLTIVSNACGTLWNLSARDAKDQEALWELGAVGMLRNLIHSRHKMIAMGSAAALRNLMANRPARYKDASVVSPGAGAPSLHARKQKALFEELDAQQLSETFDNIDNLSPKAAHRKGRGCNGAGGGGGGNTTRSYTNTPVLSSPKNGDGSKRTGEEVTYARPVFPPSVRASSDSLNSVTSADGYGNRGKTKPSAEPFYSSDESRDNKCCVYRKYPADLAHKIRSANHMADDDGAELDTPINYSLKYSDEQLNSGRQSPSHRGSIESDEDDETDARLRRRNDGGDSAPTSGRIASTPQPRYVVATATSDYVGDSTGEQPIDYSLKYGTDAARKPLFKPQETAAPSVPPPPSSSANKLRPPPPTANRTGPKGNQESTQTYCVEDTPICFSRGSSLSSLSSEEEDEDGDVIGRKRRGGSGGGSNDYPTLPVSEKDAHEQQQRQQKEAESQTATATAASSSRGRRAHHHHHGHAHHHHHHHVTSSGARTPKSPPEQPYAQETPLMFSRCTSVSSLDSFSTSSIASSVRSSEPCSGVPSGVVSPSDLPDSPGQTMPPSRSKTPPLPPATQNTKEEEKTKKKDEEESSADVLLHFATESTPHGFSRASSLSALSLDEPYIAAEMRGKKEEEEGGNEERKEEAAAKPILDESDDDDDIEILEACINMAMPKSSRKPKKQQQAAPRKPSQLPVYKLHPPQSRAQSQQRKDVPPPAEEVPRVYCVEGTPLNFSTATSLSDLTIDSPPNEEAAAAVIPVAPPPSSQRRGAGLPEGENGDDILAECISAAMPKAKPRKPIRAAANSEHLQAPPLPPPVPPPLGLQQQKKKPTSPVKPMPQRAAYGVATATAAKAKPGFAFDSPHHYTPIEGTPCCFSRNDSLSSLDFDEDDGGEKDEEKKRKEEEGRKRKQQTAAVFPRTKPATNAASTTDEKQKFAIEDTPVCFSRNSSLSSLSDIDQENNNKEFAPPPPPPPEQQDGGKAAIKSPPPPQEELKPRPNAASGYAPKAFHVEDTPVCFSRNSSLSSLSIDSEDDLLQECISSAMPKKKKKAAAAAANASVVTPLPVTKAEDGILAEEEPSEAPRSPASPDSESFDWKAIQEGANSIVSSLNAAAAAATSLSRQPSSDSDSVLSLKSVGSPFRLPAANNNAEEDVEEKEEAAVKRGARILKSGERSSLEAKKKKEELEEEEEAKALRGGKKVYSRSLITGKPRAEPAARGRSKPRAAAVAKPPGSSEGADRGGGSSRDSTPSRSSTAANQKGGKLLQMPRTASPGSASSSSSSASRPAKQSGAARSGGGGGIPRSESASRVSGSTAAKKPKAEPEKPALVRQSTFIKEAPSPTLKRKLEESAAAAAAAAAAATALESPSSPDTPLPATTRRHDVNRSHSESPSRPQEVTSSRFSRTGTWKRENSAGGGGGGGSGGKHSTSLPRVGTWKRSGSSSSVLSASSESSEKGRSEEESAVRSKGTWRKAKSGGGGGGGGSGGSDSSAGRSFAEKSEDVWVRLEDCPVNNPRSSSSCSARSPTTANAPPVIDSPASSKIPSSSSSSSSNLNLRRSCESLDDKPPPPPPPERPQHQQQQQRSQQRSGAVAARVSPFNYTPSPRKSNSEVTTTPTPTPTPTTTTASSTTPTRPSLIPTPVTKKREPKGGEGGGSGGERGSYIVTSV